MAKYEKSFLEDVLDTMTMKGLIEASRDSDGKINPYAATSLASLYGYTSCEEQSQFRTMLHREIDQSSASTSTYIPVNYESSTVPQEEKVEVKSQLPEGRNYTDAQAAEALEDIVCLFIVAGFIYYFFGIF